MVVGLVAGSFLGFGVYSAQIRKNGRFTATESHTLGIIMDLGGSPTHPFFLSLSLSLSLFPLRSSCYSSQR